MSNTLPAYPAFKKITIEDASIFTDFCNRYPPYSDFNLLSLLSWDFSGVNMYSILNDNLVIKIKDYLGDGFIYSVLGIKMVDLTLKRLLTDFNKLTFVPEIVVNNIKRPEQYLIEPDRDNDDYMLSTEKITKLEGHCFRHLRQDVERFKRQYSCHVIKDLDLTNSETMGEIIRLTEKWFLAKEFNEEKKQEEMQMLHNFVTYSRNFKCLYLGLYVDDVLIAYIFSEVISPNIVISHFGVADSSFECSSPMMEYMAAHYFYDHGITFQNQEQDAGLPGLRRAKLFYNPEYFLKKFLISSK